MKEEKNKTLEQKFRDAFTQTTLDKGSTKPNPQVKIWLNVGGILILIWASRYVFSALAGAVRGFKDLRKSIQEK